MISDMGGVLGFFLGMTMLNAIQIEVKKSQLLLGIENGIFSPKFYYSWNVFRRWYFALIG